MAEYVKSILWEAYERPHREKKSDWFWIVGIVVASSAIAAILLGNTLLGILIFTAGIVVLILAAREPKLVPMGVTQRGIRIEERLYPYTTLEAYYIDEEHPYGPHLFVRSEKFFMPLLIMPLPEEYLEDIEEMIAYRLPESHIEEPVAHRLLELFGF